MVIILFVGQLVYTLNTTHQIRYEEISESIYNVLLLNEGYVYHGGASNLGWYSLLLFVYKFFGFSIFTAKYLRLVISLVSLICLALWLKKMLGTKNSLVPLLTIGLSPILLFYNTLQTEYGLDLQYLPIGIFLISKINFKNSPTQYAIHAFVGFFLMFAWLSYPTFIFYIPILVFYYLWNFQNSNPSKKLSTIVKFLPVSLAFFVLPILVSFVYLKNSRSLLNDLNGLGLFRGGGEFDMHPVTISQNISGLSQDLFVRGQSYLLEIKNTDFANIIPLPSVLITAIITLQLILVKKYRLIFGLVLLLMLANFILSSISFDPTFNPGVRRYTPILAGLYAFFTLVWHYTNSKKTILGIKKNIVLAVLLLLPIHHMLVVLSFLLLLFRLMQIPIGIWPLEGSCGKKEVFLRIFLGYIFMTVM